MSIVISDTVSTGTLDENRLTIKGYAEVDKVAKNICFDCKKVRRCT